ncbi:MAG: transglycosylase domain-containing protein, partial [Deltaproteobacteria bacterium]|nr:transglycosylase domain-containing protein [Deltaproteobacteria bacterium]
MRPGNQVELSAAGDVNTASPQVRPWRHPQAWVPLELSFYFFIAPFLFWPAAVALLALQMFSQDLDGMPISSLKGYQLPTVTFIMTADGMPMAEIYREHRLVVPLDYMPRHVVDAFVAAEDSSFFRHQGIDLVGIGRALLANVRTGQPVQGASTITQQMIRNFLLSNEKSYERKVKEVILAWRAERLLTKDEILHLYLNQIFLGRGAYGVESAARLYFGKSIRDVNLAEAAMLAGLGKAPGRYRAHEGTEASRD